MLRAWQDSPTRFTEDTNAERDLRVGGYRDRLLVELAQNAADAAALAGAPGTLRLAVTSGELRVANTGEPLDADGVAGLASLRASAKRAGTVGRFGVGFAAVLAITDAPRVVSVTGGVAFSARRTIEATGRSGEVPVLRLPWPVPADEDPVPDGFSTEVRLPLRSGVDQDGVLDELAAQVSDVLLALPWLGRVELDGRVWTRAERAGGVVEIERGRQVRRWLTSAGEGCVWAVPVDAGGVPQPLDTDLLHAPTPTDERLSLPARLIAALPIEPSRRHVLPGAELDAALALAAAAYPGIASALAPEHRLAMVPPPDFPRSEVDGKLRDQVAGELAGAEWLPGASGARLAPQAAVVLPVDSPDLVAVLAELVPGLVAAPVCGGAAARVLAPLGARRIEIAEVMQAISGVDRAPGWWRWCYDTLLELLESREIRDSELGDLPVPLADGRTIPGPRDALLLDASAELLELIAAAGITGLRLVHPELDHPLLLRLGARWAEPDELLAAPALAEAVTHSVGAARAGADLGPLLAAVLELAAVAGTGVDLGSLALPGRHGWRRADELLLADAELLDVLDEDALGGLEHEAPLDVLDAAALAAATAQEVDAQALRRVGVLDGFAVVTDPEPAGPNHDLPEEQQWLASLPDPAPPLRAVRDIDLVADDRWPEALRLLAARPDTWQALSDPGGHTGWWIARYALLAGSAPLDWRLPAADALAGLYDPLPDLGLTDRLALAAGVRAELVLADADDANDLLERLGDPEREVPAGLACRAHSILARAALDDVAATQRVRALDGSLCRAEDAAVLDRPWLLGLWQPAELVAATDFADAEPLADLLDLPLAGELSTAEIVGGDYATWRDMPAVGEVAQLLGIELPDGGVLLHEQLSIADRHGTEVAVPWWSDGRLHAEDSTAGLARAFAWAAGRWQQRHLIAALLDDPGVPTLLG